MKAKLFAAAFGVALAASVMLSAFLFRQADAYYRELNAVRLDPLGTSVYAQATAPPLAPHTLRVVMLGDSRAQNWPTPTLPGVQFINRGIGAQTTAQVLGRFETDVAPLRPDVVVLQVGINDLKVIGVAPNDAQAIRDACLRNIRAIVSAAKRLGAKVILTTIIPSTGQAPLARRLYWSGAIDTAVTEINAELRNIHSDDVMILDAATLLADTEGRLRPGYATDLLHLNGAGYDALNEALVAQIEATRLKQPNSALSPTSVLDNAAAVMLSAPPFPAGSGVVRAKHLCADQNARRLR
jgi:lysophospholipase L1-like esterase